MREPPLIVDCAICLTPLDDTKRALTLPCRHAWHLPCIWHWLDVSADKSCPLCKCVVASLAFEHSGGDTTVSIPQSVFLPSVPPSTSTPRSSSRTRRPVLPTALEKAYETALNRRRFVYRNGLRACHLGRNEHTRMRNLLTPARFRASAALQSRARSFLRRELAVFPFLHTAFSAAHTPTQTMTVASVGTTSREIEFLTTYICSLLRLVDVQSQRGASFALGILSDHLTRRHASLLLHELRCFLNSPFRTLGEYDRVVQYVMPRDDGGTPLFEISDADVARHLKRFGRDVLVEIPRAYKLRRR
ncbi:uncharacterized protein V1518DRAFT_414340 [Limtongia smithiae]|uniref:uncharacterized protein n=1 Tax=Limtongia smithiae TaxID=1125753 RepID=UPI0034CED6F0